MSHYYALCIVLKTCNALIETLQVIRDTEGPGDRRCGITAGGLLKYFTSKIFLLTAYSFENMFNILVLWTSPQPSLFVNKEIRGV